MENLNYLYESIYNSSVIVINYLNPIKLGFSVGIIFFIITFMAGFKALSSLIHYRDLDSEDKKAFVIILAGSALIYLGIFWKTQLLSMREEIQVPFEIHWQLIGLYHKLAVWPMLLQTIGFTLIGLSAFIRTKTHIFLKIIALLYTIYIILLNLNWYVGY